LANHHKSHQQVQLLKGNIDLFEYFINHFYIRGLVLKNHLLVGTSSSSSSTLASGTGVKSGVKSAATRSCISSLFYVSLWFSILTFSASLKASLVIL
jgi:hypothetical protein